jgi:mono/diheme cytochrome c family protein
MRLSLRLLAAVAALVLASPIQAQAQAQLSRGQLLYSTHCVECHTSQMHWRDKRLASDWATLKIWVRKWQEEARLHWTEEDVEAVARYLNETIYQFPQPHASR